MATDGVQLREALRLPPLRDARVVGGADGLDRIVRQVNVMEVPDILDWVKPDELLLTTAYPLRDERASLDQLVPRLNDKGLAGLAIKPDRYIHSIPLAMVEAADRLGFPLLELPPATSFDDVINSVLGVILNAQAMRMQRAAAIHDRLTSIVLEGGGLREIALALAELVGRQTAILDTEGRVLAVSSIDPGRGAFSRSLPWRSDGSSDGSRVQWVATAERVRPTIALQLIQVGREKYGAIAVEAEEGTLGEDEIVAMERAAMVAALRLVQGRAVAEADRRFQTICLEELVTGHITDRSVLQERAVAFGWDLTQPMAIIVAELEALGDQPFGRLAGTREESQARHRIAEAARAALGRGAIIWERSVGVAALVASPQGATAPVGEGGERLLSEVRTRLPGAVMSVGIGRVYRDPLELKYSYNEALRSLEIARWAHRTGEVLLFDELGLDRLLISCPEEELVTFCRATIGPLMKHDAAHRSQLLETLDVYLSCGGNAAEAARLLYVHYNTLKHRLVRIAAILGPFEGDPEHVLNLSLALRIRRLLPAPTYLSFTTRLSD